MPAVQLPPETFSVGMVAIMIGRSERRVQQLIHDDCAPLPARWLAVSGRGVYTTSVASLVAWVDEWERRPNRW